MPRSSRVRREYVESINFTFKFDSFLHLQRIHHDYSQEREDAKLWAEIEQDRKRAAAQRAAATNQTLSRSSEQQQ
jgi:hypothetical protein